MFRGRMLGRLAMLALGSVFLAAPAALGDDEAVRRAGRVLEAPTPPADLPEFSEREWERLREGRPVKRAEAFDTPDGRAGRGVVYIMVGAEPEEIFRQILDYDRYVEFYPNVEESTLYRREGNEYWARFVLTAAGGLVKIRYHCHHVYDPERGTVTWELDDAQENDFRATVGFWKIWVPEPGRCLLAYSVQVDSGRWIPRFLEEMGTGYGLRRVAACMKRRVESGGAYRH